jgi:hypothetical protein
MPWATLTNTKSLRVHYFLSTDGDFVQSMLPEIVFILSVSLMFFLFIIYLFISLI